MLYYRYIGCLSLNSLIHFFEFVLGSRQTSFTILCGEYYFPVHLSVSILNTNSHYSKTIYTTALKFLTFVNILGSQNVGSKSVKYFVLNFTKTNTVDK